MSGADYRLGRLGGDWVVTFTENGNRKRFRLFPRETGNRTRREAEDRLASWVRNLAAASAPTVHDLWEAYRHDKTGRRVAVAMEFEWRAMREHFGHLRPEEVTTDIVRAWTARRRAAGKHDGTIWTELGHLRSVMLWAEALGRIDRAPKIERPSKPPPKERYLTRSECERLLNVCSAPHISLAVQLLLGTAARVGAILDLRWDRVDLDRGIIRLAGDTHANRKGRATVPVHRGLRAALQTARDAATCDNVIEYAGRPVKGIKTGFNAACKAAGLAGVTPHVLRHTAAVHMAEAGVPMAEIAQYLGHGDSRITERVYARFSPDHLRKAAEVLDFSTIRRAK